MEALIVSLQSRHAALERRLCVELKRPQPDGFEVRRIKAAKLKVKDELMRLWRKRRDKTRMRLTS